MMILTLIDAFRRFGAKQESRLSSLSAIAADADGDRFVIDFTRPQAASPALTGPRK